MTMSPIPVPTNYAEQVLREEAERLAKLKESAASAVKSTTAAKVVEGKEESSRVEVNLKDENNFPTLGKAKGNLLLL